MMNLNRILFFCIILELFTACNDTKKDAQLYLDNARSLYKQGDYDLAKLKLDTLQKRYPKALPQIKESLILLQEVRRAKNIQLIAVCDSLINLNQPKVDALKTQFTYQRDKQYQESGSYVPKGVSANADLDGTTLRAAVSEEGSMYIESVFVGQGLHNAVIVTAKNGESAESLPVTDDGLNFRFTTLGKQYEVIRFNKASDNGLSHFIYSNADQPLMVLLKGKPSVAYPLLEKTKKSIKNAYELSVAMLHLDSLKSEKEKAGMLLNYLDSKK